MCEARRRVARFEESIAHLQVQRVRLILKEPRKDRGTIVCGRTKCGLSIEDSGNIYAFCLKNSLEVKEKVVLGVTIGQARDLLAREVVGCSG